VSEEEERKLQLEVHVSEYQAVSNRSTSYAVISSAIWPVIGAYLTLVVTYWGRIAQRRYGAPIAVWVSGLIIEMLLLYWAHWMYEQYMMVLYIEQRLRPLVQKIVATPCFWLYEPFLAKRRVSGLYFAWEVKVRWAMLVVLVTTACFRAALLLRGYTPFGLVIECLGLLVNSILVRLLFQACASVTTTRREWELSEHDVIEQCYSNSQPSKQGQKV
jgi:hypothetical protein